VVSVVFPLGEPESSPGLWFQFARSRAARCPSAASTSCGVRAWPLGGRCFGRNTCFYYLQGGSMLACKLEALPVRRPGVAGPIQEHRHGKPRESSGEVV
jgi:hypothetical protein